MENTAVWHEKPERWGSLLVQEKYQGEKAVTKIIVVVVVVVVCNDLTPKYWCDHEVDSQSCDECCENNHRTIEEDTIRCFMSSRGASWILFTLCKCMDYGKQCIGHKNLKKSMSDVFRGSSVFASCADFSFFNFQLSGLLIYHTLYSLLVFVYF